jgi:hypothetical protein
MEARGRLADSETAGNRMLVLSSLTLLRTMVQLSLNNFFKKRMAPSSEMAAGGMDDQTGDQTQAQDIPDSQAL